EAGEQGVGEQGAPDTRSGNDRRCTALPVGGAESNRAHDVCAGVDDHQHAPDAEADRVHHLHPAAALPDDDQSDSAPEERERRGDEKWSEQPQREPGWPPPAGTACCPRNSARRARRRSASLSATAGSSTSPRNMCSDWYALSENVVQASTASRTK